MGERTGKPRGRPPGAKNKRTEQREQKTAEAAAQIAETLGEGAFGGDAHAFLVAVYKSPANELHQRIDAAKAAIRYEKPALAAVDLGNKDDKPFEQVMRWAQSPDEATTDPSRS